MSQPLESASASHLAALTWLRAIAAFLVVVSHAIRGAEVTYFPGDGEPTLLLLRLFDLGDFGVCLFFVLSGCTLTLSTRGRMTGLDGIWSFYLRRFMRIWPAFAISLVVYLAFIYLFDRFHENDQRPWVQQFVNRYSLGDVLRYLSLSFNITGPRNLFNMAYWTLPVEFQFYLLLPFALLLMQRSQYPLLTPIAFGATLWGLDHWFHLPLDRTEVFSLAYTFFGGVFLATVSTQWSRHWHPMWGAFCFIFVFMFLALDEAGLLPSSIHHLGLGPSGHYGLTALLCVAIALRFKSLRLPSFIRRFMDTYGEISYSIYLYHVLCINLAILVLNQGRWSTPNEKLLFIFIAAFFTSGLLGKMGYHLIEQPAIRLGRLWTSKT